MIRSEIRQRFRDENPEITANVVSDVTLNSWMQTGDKEICAKARLIVDTDSVSAVEDQSQYDFTSLISKFFDIDEYPGGGISIIDTDGNETRLFHRTKAELDQLRRGWRTQASGTPKDYYRRGKYVYLVPAPDDSIASLNVDNILISDAFDDDAKTPYNQRLDLEPFHPGILFYLKWRAKDKIGKPEESMAAFSTYGAYVEWMRKSVGGGKYGPINFVPTGITPLKGRR